jgi:hypothetical protein
MIRPAAWINPNTGINSAVGRRVSRLGALNGAFAIALNFQHDKTGFQSVSPTLYCFARQE